MDKINKDACRNSILIEWAQKANQFQFWLKDNWITRLRWRGMEAKLLGQQISDLILMMRGMIWWYSLSSSVEKIEIPELESDPLAGLSKKLITASDILRIGSFVKSFSIIPSSKLRLRFKVSEIKLGIVWLLTFCQFQFYVAESEKFNFWW